MSIVDDLLKNTGTYLGIDTGHGSDAAARMVITPLPGGAGVTLDYETFNPNDKDRLQGHAEHAVIARTGSGAVYVAGHIHADVAAVMRETETGVFELGDEPNPFPMAIHMSMPEPGRLIHSWWYARPGQEPVEQDRAEVTLRR